MKKLLSVLIALVCGYTVMGQLKMSDFPKLNIADTGTYIVVVQNTGGVTSNRIYKSTGIIFKKDSTLYVTSSANRSKISFDDTIGGSGANLIATQHQLNTIAFDTVTLSNRINTKLGYSDTVLRVVTPKNLRDSTSVLRAAIGAKLNYTDSTSIFVTPKNLRDSTSVLRTAIGAKLNYTDSTSLFVTPKNLRDSLNLETLNKVSRRGNFGDTSVFIRLLYSGVPTGRSFVVLDSNRAYGITNYNSISTTPWRLRTALPGAGTQSVLDLGYRIDNSTMAYSSIYPTVLTGNRNHYLQDKDGTLAYLSDIRDSGLVMRTFRDSASLKVGGNTNGRFIDYGTVDSFGIKMKVFNETTDSIDAIRRTHYFISRREAGFKFTSRIGVADPTIQSAGIWLGVGNGNVTSSNFPYIAFMSDSSTPSSTSRILDVIGFRRWSNLSFLNTSNNSPVNLLGALTGTSSGDAFRFGFQSYSGNLDNTPSSGTINFFNTLVTNGTNGQYNPSGTATLNVYNTSLVMNQNTSATGITRIFTDVGATITNANRYRCFEATKNVGFGFYSSGTARNSFVGRVTVGDTTDDGSNQLQIYGNLALRNAGNKINIATGTNASTGTATLSSGTVTVNTTAVTANSIILITAQESGTITGVLRVSARTAGTSFTITSSVNTDNATIGYLIIN